MKKCSKCWERYEDNVTTCSKCNALLENLQITTRPIFITIIGWIVIVLNCLMIFISLAILNSKDHIATVPFGYAGAFASFFLAMACGIGILKRQNWGRFLYVVLGLIANIRVLTATPPYERAFLGLAIFIIITIVLFLPKSNKYFSQP